MKAGFSLTLDQQPEHTMPRICECEWFLFIQYIRSSSFSVLLPPFSCLVLSSSDVVPSFVLMDITGTQIVVYVYQLTKEVKVQKIEYKKKS